MKKKPLKLSVYVKVFICFFFFYILSDLKVFKNNLKLFYTDFVIVHEIFKFLLKWKRWFNSVASGPCGVRRGYCFTTMSSTTFDSTTCTRLFQVWRVCTRTKYILILSKYNRERPVKRFSPEHKQVVRKTANPTRKTQ